MRKETGTEILASEIPIEIVSDEEMSLIEAAFSLASTSLSLRLCRNSTKRIGDIEDGIEIDTTHKNKKKKHQSLLRRFKSKTGLFVTDITSTVITKVDIIIRSAEEHWALKMINFIHGTNQLFLDGLTRELPLIGFANDVCVVGVIDELRLKTGTVTLVETKTRSQNNLPSEPQQRNGRLQLMCYKYLWDKLLAHPFPTQHFIQLFSLNPDYLLSQEIRELAIQAGAPIQTLKDVLGKYQYVCSMLPEAQDQLLLRYEYQNDQSLIGEYQYLHDSDWVSNQIQSSLEFWKGEREAKYVLENERWKCKHCKYASRCPVNTTCDPTILT